MQNRATIILLALHTIFLFWYSQGYTVFGMGVSTASLSWFMPILWFTKTGKSFCMAYCPIDIPHLWHFLSEKWTLQVSLLKFILLFYVYCSSFLSLLNCNSVLLGMPILHKFLLFTNLIRIFSSASMKSLKNTECSRIQSSALYTWQFLPAWRGHIPPILIPSIGSTA